MKQLLRQWGPEFDKAQTAPLRGGIWHVSLHGREYVLKHRTNRTRVWEEDDLMKWLAAHRQPISQLMYTVEGAPWAEYEGGVYVLYPYLVGMGGDQLELLDEDYGLKIGAALARLHLDLAAYPAVENFPGFDVFQEVSSFAWPAIRGYMGTRFRHTLQDMAEGISRNLVNPYQTLPRQLIHRDFHPGNLIFQEGELVGILDFDRVRVGIRLFDLCYVSTAVLSGCFENVQLRESWSGFVQALLKGYQSVLSLEQTEAFSFLYVIYLIQFLFIGYHLDTGSTELADFNIAMLLWFGEQHDFLEPLIEKSVAG